MGSVSAYCSSSESAVWPCSYSALATFGNYAPNNPLVGNAFCPRLGDKGASTRLASCSRRLEGL
jgi:hypothetical protein